MAYGDGQLINGGNNEVGFCICKHLGKTESHYKFSLFSKLFSHAYGPYSIEYIVWTMQYGPCSMAHVESSNFEQGIQFFFQDFVKISAFVMITGSVLLTIFITVPSFIRHYTNGWKELSMIKFIYLLLFINTNKLFLFLVWLTSWYFLVIFTSQFGEPRVYPIKWKGMKRKSSREKGKTLNI